MTSGFGDLLIQARSVAVVYNRCRSFFRSDPFEALKDVSLDIYAGESLGVIGRNGVGKTTLLRVLAKIIMPDRGSVTNYGASTAMLSLQAGFDIHASGRTNILLSALLLGFTEEEIRERMDEIIEYSELGDFIDQPIVGYSAGMRARLGFSVCYYMQPDVLLIDEALGVGDLEFREKSAKAMHEKIKSDQTVVLVSHDARTIRDLCNRAVWIEDGVSRMEGDVESVVTAYQEHVRSRSRVEAATLKA
ncbi:ABC transporter ATP-binding protein [Pseudomonadota bacterium]